MLFGGERLTKQDGCDKGAAGTGEARRQAQI